MRARGTIEARRRPPSSASGRLKWCAAAAPKRPAEQSRAGTARKRTGCQPLVADVPCATMDVTLRLWKRPPGIWTGGPVVSLRRKSWRHWVEPGGRTWNQRHGGGLRPHWHGPVPSDRLRQHTSSSRRRWPQTKPDEHTRALSRRAEHEERDGEEKAAEGLEEYVEVAKTR